MVLSDIDRKTLDRITIARRAGKVTIRTKSGVRETGKKVAHATVNRTLEIVRSILNSAVEWEWIDKAPRVQKMSEPTKRISWITQEQANRLITVLPKHLADMALFSLETGLRRSNVTGLKWSQIDLTRKMAWIHPDEAKAKKAIPVPLSDAAIEVLRRQRFSKRDPDFLDSVFVYGGKPVYQTSTKAWKKALAKAGISDFRWHDLRHTWASWHVQRGTPLHVLQALGGWETVEMVQRYAHLSADHLAQWVQSFNAVNCNFTVVSIKP